MSEHAELVQDLRSWLTGGVTSASKMREAADAIEALEHERDEWRQLHEQSAAAEGTRAEHAECERDAAVADNAALLSQMGILVGVIQWMSGSADFGENGEAHVHWSEHQRPELFAAIAMLEESHPGAALLARMARLEAVDEAVRKWEAGEEAEWVVVRAALDAAENANLT